MRVFCLSVFLLAASLASAQFGQEVTGEVPSHQVKLSLFDLLDPYPPSLVIGYEQSFAKQFGAFAEAGPAFNSEGNRIRGIKGRGGLRFYRPPNQNGDRAFWGLQVMYKDYKRSKTGTFCRDNCAYFQELDYDHQGKVTDVHGAYGKQFMISSHFILEISGFVGRRWSDRKETGIPEDAELVEEQSDFIGFEATGKTSFISIGMHFRIGYTW